MCFVRMEAVRSIGEWVVVWVHVEPVGAACALMLLQLSWVWFEGTGGTFNWLLWGGRLLWLTAALYLGRLMWKTLNAECYDKDRVRWRKMKELRWTAECR